LHPTTGIGHIVDSDSADSPTRPGTAGPPCSRGAESPPRAEDWSHAQRKAEHGEAPPAAASTMAD